MSSKKKQPIKFKGMSYRQVQRFNSNNKKHLEPEDKKWLKDNFYKNIGWQNVINLYQKIEEFLDKYKFADFTLEELFLEADRIGNKYLTQEEIAQYNQQLSQIVSEISEEIDQQFPDTEIEIIDFGKQK